jgi:hypothetical protein
MVQVAVRDMVRSSLGTFVRETGHSIAIDLTSAMTPQSLDRKEINVRLHCNAPYVVLSRKCTIAILDVIFRLIFRVEVNQNVITFTLGAIR